MSSMKLFNFKYAKQNTKKSIGFLAVLFIVIPILSLVSLYNYANLSDTQEPFQIRKIIVPNLMGMFILPFLLSNVLLGYVYSQKQIDFTNSMPISRKKIFFTNIIIGVVYLVLMQFVTLLFSSVYLTISNTFLVTFEMLFDIFLVLTIGYIFVYIVSMLALSISGNTFMQFFIILLILFLIPFIRNIFFYTIHTPKPIDFINADGTKYTYTEIPSEYYLETCTIPVNTVLKLRYYNDIYNTKSMIATVILSVIYLIIGNKVFEKKKMESAGYSFNSEKIHLFVKILTLYPIVVIFYALHKELLAVQNILIIVLIFAYYYVFDLITNKKIKLKITLVTFIVAFIVLFGISYGQNYLTQRAELNKNNEQINYDDIEKVCINTNFISTDSYELEGKENWSKIFDNLLQEPKYTVEITEDIEEEQEYSQSLNVSLKLKNGKTKEIIMYVPTQIYIELLEKMKNDDQYIEKLCQTYKISPKATVIQQEYYKVLPLKDYEETRNEINNYLGKEYMKGLIQNAIDYLVPNEINNQDYTETVQYYIYDYSNHTYKRFYFETSAENSLNDKLIKMYNQISKERIEELLTRRENGIYPLGVRLWRRLEDKTYQYAYIEYDFYGNKDMINFIMEDYTNDFDSSKPYYRIKEEWTGAIYYTNNIEKLESILEKNIDLEEVFKTTE